ncbi:MAG: transglycosylase domain-containing protein [Candidatus Roizmanbacteria bacterium]
MKYKRFINYTDYLNRITKLHWKIKTGVVFFILIMFFFIWTDPSIHQTGTIKIYDKNNILLYEQAGNVGRKQYIEYKHIPKHVIQAIIATEDERYYHHFGVDITSIIRATFTNISEKKVISGASTITQQLARILIIKDDWTTQFIWIRKIKEIVVAMRINATYSKDEILSMYINEVYLGNHNYGFQTASHYYFNKDASKLSLAESAYLTGMISSPALYDPYSKKENGVVRSQSVLHHMREQQFITAEQEQNALKEKLIFNDPQYEIKAPHFVDYILEELRRLTLPNENVSVHTTLDLNLYNTGLQMSRDWIHKLKEAHNVSNASIIILDNKTGAILNMQGGIHYFDTKNGGQVNVTTALRQPGSAIKTITYATALLKGFSPATLLYDIKKPFLTSSQKGFIPNNYGDVYHGPVLVREALASSYNMSAVEMLEKVSMESFLDTAYKLGIRSYTRDKSYDFAITLGANEVTLLELSNAYATLARSGTFIDSFSISSITDAKGKELYKHTIQKQEQVLSEKSAQVSYLITDILSDPIARMPGFGEKNSLSLSRPVAVKTGTTTDWHDIWTIGYTPSYTVGVWMGNTNNEEMRDITSSQGSAPLWNELFEELLKGTPEEQFARPSGIVEKQICKLNGSPNEPLCPAKKMELFISGTEPKQTKPLYKNIAIDTRNNLLATQTCPEQYINRRIMIDYPSEVYSWAKTKGKETIPTEYSPLCSLLNTNQKRIDTSNHDFIEITNPKHKSTFQSAPLLIKNQGIVFEANTSSQIQKIEWFVDNTKWKSNNERPFSVIFPLQKGSHIVYAKGVTRENIEVSSQHVSFTIVDF